MKSSWGAVMMYRLEEASAELALSRNLVRISFLIYFIIIDIFYSLIYKLYMVYFYGQITKVSAYN